MCASVCPSEALWFGTPDEFAATPAGTLVNEWWFGNQYVATKVRTVADSPGRRSTSWPPPAPARGRTTRSASTSWREDRDGPDHSAGEPDQRGAVADPVWRQDFPLTSAGEDEVTRREFVRYLVLASGGFAAGNVGVAVWSSLRSINEGEPRPIVALAQVPEGTAHLFHYPTGADPAILVHLPGGELRAFSQKCTHLGCVVYYAPDRGRWSAPATRATSTPSPATCWPGPPSGRWAASTSRSATARCGRSPPAGERRPRGAAMSDRPIPPPVLPAHRTGRDGRGRTARCPPRSASSSSCCCRCRSSCSRSASTPCSPTTTGSPGSPAALSVLLAAGAAAFYRYLR